MKKTTEECIDWLDTGINTETLINTKGGHEMLVSIRAKLLAAQGLIDALEDINKLDTIDIYNSESDGVYAQIARRALAEWKDS